MSQQETIEQQMTEQFLDLYQSYRHQNQRDFYTSRVREFTRAQRQSTWVSIGLVFLTALAGTFEGVVPAPFKSILLLVAAICPILVTTLAGYTALHAFTQQAKLYRDAQRKLNHIRVPRQIPGQSPQAFADDIKAYVEDVEGVLKTERGFWGQLLEDIAPPGA